MSCRATVLMPRKVPSPKPVDTPVFPSHQISLQWGVSLVTSEKRLLSSALGV